MHTRGMFIDTGFCADFSMAQAEETSLSLPSCVVTVCQNKGCLLGEIASHSWQNASFPPEPHLPGLLWNCGCHYHCTNRTLQVSTCLDWPV